MELEKRNPSQSAIAKRAGVARTTVSLVLRGGRGLNPATVKKVLKAAEELGYRPNMLVKSIRTGKTRMIGVMMPPSDSHWAKIMYGIHDELTDRDYVPLFLWSAHEEQSYDEQRELAQVHRMLDRRIDGVILWPLFAKMYSQHIQEFSSRNLPVVTVDCRINKEVKADSVCSDDYEGVKAVVEHLTGKGHRRFIHFSGPLNEEWAKMRRTGFRNTLKACGFKARMVEVPMKGPYEQIIRAELSRMNGPTAVFAATDNIARTVYQVAFSMGLNIPDDLSVVGFGDLDFSQHLHPPLTTVHAAPYEMGRRAAQIVIDRVEGVLKDRHPISLYLPVELAARGSVATVS